ncbi:DUF1573 domain-containing protein [Faecalibacter macacae]|uniref:DUF1573 domain-containing protein n=1 Tax=Faecalibacter macacae TaxID=1859289 RepID=A0A3L9MES6_9FLAO|nr:DUF1573 domain-containing protein [Faecalibacter macacae]RLZ09754.1 DUF1573 domain-containing protein [Faecalibacter macacae]
MKKIMLLGAFAMGMSTLFAQELKLGSENIEFGDVKLGTNVTSVIKVTNSGKEPLVIKSVVGSCGCTVPEYPKTPIAPGETADIKVNYSVGSVPGVFNKTVTITSNDVVASRKIFRVKGTAK